MNRFGTLLLAAMLALPACALATTYKWVDANGVVHYSDKPHRGAKQLNLPPAVTYKPPPVAHPGQSAAAAGSYASQPAYSQCHISQPAPDETFWNTGGKVPVTVQLSPGLAPGDLLTYMVDGKPTPGSPTRNLAITLTGLYRGAHTVAVSVSDASGKPLISSPPVTFYVKQHFIKK